MVKLNVDGAPRNRGLAGCGCVIRSYEGRWPVGAAKCLGISSAFHAELAAVPLGLELVWDCGFRCVQLETDSASVRYLLISPSPFHLEVEALLYDCQQLLTRTWTVEVKLIFREANGVADGLASWVLGRSVGCYLLATPPLSIHSLLLANQIGLVRPRIVTQNGLAM